MKLNFKYKSQFLALAFALFIGFQFDANAQTITQSTNPNLVTFGTTVMCSAPGIPNSTDNAYLRRFELFTDHGISAPWIVNSVDIGFESITGTGPHTVTVNLYSIAAGAAFTFANMTPAGSTTIDIGPGGLNFAPLTINNVPIPGATPINTGDHLVVEVFLPTNSTAGFQIRHGSNTAGETKASFLAAAGCGAPDPVPVGTLGAFTVHLAMQVNGAAVAAGAGIPTTSQWGLILITLLLLSYGLIIIGRTQPALVGQNSGNVDFSTGKLFGRFPLEKSLFSKAMFLTIPLAIAGFVAAFFAYDAKEDVIRDIVGIMICAPVFAYLVHLFLLFRKK